MPIYLFCTLLTFPNQIEPFIPNIRVEQFLKTKLTDLDSPNVIIEYLG